MKRLFKISFLIIAVLISNISFNQCKADSIITYRIVGGVSEIATIEYFKRDVNDSIISQDFIQFQNGKKASASQNTNEWKKVKGKWVLEKHSATWAAEELRIIPVTKSYSTYDKKLRLLSEVHQNFKLIGEQSNYINQSKVDYVYSKTGQLINQFYSVWNPAKSVWQNQSNIAHSYNEFNFKKETITSTYDTLQNFWTNSRKNEFGYDSLQKLTETITYQYIKDVWVPHSRVEYGVDTTSNMKYSVVQKWNGEKSKWINEFYYVMQLDETGKTKIEVHLSWAKTDWKIDLTVYYIYNEQGIMKQILNDKKQVIVEWFCD